MTRDFSPLSHRVTLLQPAALEVRAAACNADQHRDRMHRFEFTWIGKRTVNEVCLIVIWYSHSWPVRIHERASNLCLRL